METNYFQKQFIELLEKAGFEIFEYSGRGMYGEVCPAIKVDSVKDFYTCMGIENGKYWHDNLGKDFVIYCR